MSEGLTMPAVSPRYGVPQRTADRKRWRIRIGYHHNKRGEREPRSFYWPSDPRDNQAPPQVVADAVAEQNKWRRIVRDWREISPKLAIVCAQRDWSKPVWFDGNLIQSFEDALHLKVHRRLVEVSDGLDQAERQQADMALRWIAWNGITTVAELLRNTLSVPESVRSEFRAVYHDRTETGRITALHELQPAVVRASIEPVTIRGAVKRFLSSYETRVELKTSRAVEGSTNDVVRKRLHNAFGQSSNLENPPVRSTPIDFDASLSSIDQVAIERFAEYWHRKPVGITSERGIKNILNASRQFFAWCADQPSFGWTFPAPCRPLLTANDVQRDALPFDADGIVKIINAGGRRVRMFALFGLCVGFYQQDICETMDREFSVRGDYLTRFRSKERKRKRGRRPIRVRHFIPPEFRAIIESERNRRDGGKLFTSKSGIPLSAGTIGKRWFKACRLAGVDVSFCQLRKMGYNAVKRLSKSKEVAELWDGHAGGVSDSYDDGIFEPVNDAERLWADELRRDGILKAD